MEKDHDLFHTSKSHKMERFLEVCLLLLLYDESGYGYGLIEQLVYFGFKEDGFNVSTLYRKLRKMENDAWVSSCWEDGGPGPKRRVYMITENGKRELNHWIMTLRARKERITKVIERYEELDTSKKTED